MKTLLLFLTVCGFLGLCANELPPPPKNPPPPRFSGKNNKREAALAWRAFSKLSPAERKDLMILQRTQPEEFRKKLKELSDRELAAEREKRSALLKLVNEYRATADAAQKEALKAQIRKFMQEDYMTRLQEHRNHLEEMKRRTEKLEKELDKRQAKA